MVGDSRQNLLAGDSPPLARDRVLDHRGQVLSCVPVLRSRERVFSSLHFISDRAFEGGMERLERDQRAGPIDVMSSAALLWGTK